MADIPQASLGRLVVFTAVLTDLVVSVEALPAPGGDVLGQAFRETVAGGFNVLAAAARLGMTTAYAGLLGSDARADRTRRALLDEGVELLLPEPGVGTSGVCVVMVDASGERTMVTVEGAEAQVTAADFTRIVLEPSDVVYVSGYDLASPYAAGLGAWLATTNPAELIFDPGPLIGDLDQALLSLALRFTTWLSLNATEATVLTGKSDPHDAAITALSRDDRLKGVVVRTGHKGCLLAVPGEAVSEISAFPAPRVVDTTGAGDAHVGAFSAALANGLPATRACQWGNAAASAVVGRWGAATAPTRKELEAILLNGQSAIGRSRSGIERSS